MVEDNSQSASASQVQGSIHTPESDDKRYLSPSAKLRQKVDLAMGESLNRSKFVENYRSPDWMKFRTRIESDEEKGQKCPETGVQGTFLAVVIAENAIFRSFPAICTENAILRRSRESYQCLCLRLCRCLAVKAPFLSFYHPIR